LKQNFDVLIAGAGFAGGVCARVLAEKGKQVLVAERRSHTGGNAYDCKDQAGVLIHQYGPHIFHTNDKKVFDFLSRFTKWRRYQHKVIANLPRDNPEVVPAHKTTNGRFFFPVPFNLDSLKNAFGAKEGDRLGKKLLDAYPAQSQVTILELRQNPDPEIAAIADYVYEHVFVHYTMKQWGQTPEEIDPNTTARVPVRLSTDDRYFQDAYQGMPLEGYTAMFERMLDHPNIQVRLNTDARPLMKDFPGTMIYTGQADELFGFKYGPLPYRTLDFQFETVQKDHFQAAGTVNYTVDEAYTRITEFKLLTGQALPGVTTIMKEYSRAYTGEPGEAPYYAIINPENNALYSKYQADARKIPNLHLLGRLAEYKYYNMDAIAARALALAEQL
jgi:UDP-galactopyranose mutase